MASTSLFAADAASGHQHGTAMLAYETLEAREMHLSAEYERALHLSQAGHSAQAQVSTAKPPPL